MSSIQAPITGTLWKILVKPGDKVKAGDEVAILESMKMEIPIEAEESGIVTAVFRKEGDFINEGEPFIEIR